MYFTQIHVKALTPDIMVFGDYIFGSKLGSEEVMRDETADGNILIKRG